MSSLVLCLSSVLVACSGGQTKPLPGGLPPEYEPGRPFVLPTEAPAPAPAPAPPPSVAPAAPPPAK